MLVVGLDEDFWCVFLVQGKLSAVAAGSMGSVTRCVDMDSGHRY